MNHALSSAPEVSPRWLAFLENQGTTLLCAVTGFLLAFTVPLVGQMPVGELLLLVVAPWVLIRLLARRSWPARLQELGWFRLLLILVVVMGCGYAVSDLVRGTATDNLLRGWARVFFVGVNLLALTYLIDASWTRLFVTALALYFGNATHAVLFGPLFGEWWQFGFGYPVTVLALFLCGGRSVPIQVAVAAGFGLLNLSLGARSLGGICLLTGAIFALNYARGIWRPLAIGTALVAVVTLLFTAGTTIQQNQDHTGSNIERRSMIETAAEAFVENPAIGQGSWFTAARIQRLEERMAANDPNFRGYTAEQARQISIHSQILVALAEGGLLGGAFFLGYGALLVKTLRSLSLTSVPHRSFVLYLVIAGFWNLLMSPFSGVARSEIVLAICACLLVILQRQGELPEPTRE